MSVSELPTLILKFYTGHQDWINLIKDFVFFLGAGGVVRYLFNRRFEIKRSEIEKNLKVRDDIEGKLEEYVLENHKNKVGSGIRFIHWKNYPWNVRNDAYKHYLFVRAMDERTLPSGWIDNTGINFEEPVWFSGSSIYVDINGIFFIARKGSKYKNFKELQDKCLKVRLPFSNLVNFDFKQPRIEYEPTFYIKYKYDDFKNLYDPEFICREKLGDDFFRAELNGNRQLKKYCLLSYAFMRLKILLVEGSICQREVV